ncbi:hypothetical protein [Nonomuraea sp. NPDC049784]
MARQRSWLNAALPGSAKPGRGIRRAGVRKTTQSPPRRSACQRR